MGKKDLKSEIYNHIRNRILNAVYTPGVRISDKRLAEELGTSRTPVREALIRLVDQGLVQAEHNRGFIVREFTLPEVRDLYIVREALELLAISLTTDRMNRQKIQTIKDLLDQYPELIESGSLEAFTRADEKFHLLIAQFSGNAFLVKQLNMIHDQLAILRRSTHMLLFVPRHQYVEGTYREHQTIFELLVHGKITQAKLAMSEHIQGSLNAISEVMKKRDRFEMQT